MKTEIIIKGIGASPGIAIGRAALLVQDEHVPTGMLLQDEAAIESEILKFDVAVQQSIDEIEGLKKNTAVPAQQDALDILETHIEFLGDPQIRDDVFEKIREDKKPASDALIEVITSVVQMFNEMNDPYMRARAADVQDVGNRILRQLDIKTHSGLRSFDPGTIVIARDIAPSDTIAMDIKQVVGFATQAGGKTSHAAIIAKSRNIPAVVGCDGDFANIQNGDLIVVDGSDGIIIVNPGSVLKDEYDKKKLAHNQQHAGFSALKDVPAITTDGFQVKLLANISGADDMEYAITCGAEGSGLFRTELLFMGRNTFPSEDEQFAFYKKTALHAAGLPVIVRTIDIGGDKQLSYFGIPGEANPFLGYRAIRICLDKTDIFIAQLKAILRASSFGNFRIMFPMIGNIAELRAAKKILEEAKQQLVKQQIPFDHNIEVGIMIEIPSAAITADILAKEVDFFSIGTNDLCQYTLAVDRMNEKIKDLYEPFDPGVLRLIKNVIEQAQKNNIEVGMCGELASDPLATGLLLGMGLGAFSMSASAIPRIKSSIVRHNMGRAKEIVQHVMDMDNAGDIKAYLQETII